ncbi:MAG: GAF domain-containing protein, partial [Oscillospiraceae bacterium]|nr:GAF domain-containing protein [Oscillospiraceae bacterium]
MTAEQLRQFLDINVALATEQDREALLTFILDTAMDMTRCDGGTLYLLEDDGLHFCRMVTRSFGIREGGHDAPITLPPVPIRPSHVCARAVLENHLINVDDVHSNNEFDFSGAKRYDQMTGYCTRSMLVVPLANDKGELIGVLQLLNAMDETGDVIPFSEELQPLVAAVASQAAISLTNMQYSEQIHKLLDSLVGVLSTAIDQRTPYNANHTRNMARYAENFLDWLEETDHPWKFSTQRRRTFLLSVWLHDVGKMVIPLSVMDKDSRLGQAEKDVEHRFSTMSLLNRIAMLERRISAQQAQEEQKKLDDALAKIRKVNRQGFLPD